MWRQDHNGFSHQDPGFIDHVVNKKPEVVRVYLPPDANTLLSVADHCLRSRDYVNVIVAGKQPSPSWLDMDEAALHCARGVGIWDWAGNDDGDPDVVLACAGDVPTLEILAAADLLRRHLPDLRVRVVNVVDLMRLQPDVRAPARAARRRVRRDLHHRPPGHLRLPRLPVADPPPHLPPHGHANCMCAATRRRAPPPRRSTWSCATTWTATTWSWTSSTACPGLARRAAGLRQHMVDKRTEHHALHPPAPARTCPRCADWALERRRPSRCAMLAGETDEEGPR